MVTRLCQLLLQVRGPIKRLQDLQFVFLAARNWDVRNFQVILVDNVVNAFAFMLTYMLRLRIVKLFVMLNREILPFNFLLKLLSLLMPFDRHGQASLDLDRVVGVERLVGFRAATLIIAVLKLVMQLELLSLLIDLLRLVGLQVRHFRLVENVTVECCISVNNLMLVGAFLRPVAEADSLEPVWVLGIASA